MELAGLLLLYLNGFLSLERHENDGDILSIIEKNSSTSGMIISVELGRKLSRKLNEILTILWMCSLTGHCVRRSPKKTELIDFIFHPFFSPPQLITWAKEMKFQIISFSSAVNRLHLFRRLVISSKSTSTMTVENLSSYAKKSV